MGFYYIYKNVKAQYSMLIEIFSFHSISKQGIWLASSFMRSKPFSLHALTVVDLQTKLQDPSSTTCGIPQGSVLRPIYIFFHFYNMISQTNWLIHSDDTICVHGLHYLEVQVVLKRVNICWSYEFVFKSCCLVMVHLL